MKPIIVQSPSKPNPSPNQYELTPSMKPIPFQSLVVKPIPVKPPTNTNFPQLPLVKPQPGGPVPSKTSSFVSPASCGVSRALRTRIVGGEIAPKGLIDLNWKSFVICENDCEIVNGSNRSVAVDCLIGLS